MADSTRLDIMQAVTTLLEGTSGVNSVSEKMEHWEQIDPENIPACFPLDTDEEKEPAMIGSSGNNMIGTLTVVVTTIVYSATDETQQTRTDMIMAIEKSMVNDSALIALTQEIRPIRVVTDKGQYLNYSIFDQEFEIDYRYSATTGG